MNETLLILVLLFPPALFGIAVAVDTYLEHYQQLRAARRRHPSARPVGPEDRPDWGTRA